VEERKAIIGQFIAKGMKSEKASAIAGMSKSSYYYKPKGGKPGKRPSRKTVSLSGTLVPDKDVVEEIKEILLPEFIDYGIRRVAIELKRKAYVINHKKVARLMRENKLLNPVNRSANLLRTFVKFKQVFPGQPFEILEIDIKYIYIQGDKKNAYLITLLDTFNRQALTWQLAYTMKSIQVIELFNDLILDYLQPNEVLNRPLQLTIRSDNGSQFIATQLREYLQENQINQEFIKPRTPEQNGHIESFHNTVERLVCRRIEFETLAQAKEIFERFYDTYNNRRIMKSLIYMSPVKFIELWNDEKLVVVYDRKTRKQTFLFREQQVA